MSQTRTRPAAIRALGHVSRHAARPADAPTSRIEALSDGVFAIAMTVLVLDLRAPVHRVGELLPALGKQWPAYLSFFASFLLIGVVWTNHHATFRRIKTADRSVIWANLVILCTTVMLPFPTAVLADSFREANRADEQTAAIVYAGLAVAMAMAWLALFFLLERRTYPLPRDGSLASWRAQMRRPIIGSLGYAVGALLGLAVEPTISLAIFVMVPLYWALTSEGLRGQTEGKTATDRVTPTTTTTGPRGPTGITTPAASRKFVGLEVTNPACRRGIRRLAAGLALATRRADVEKVERFRLDGVGVGEAREGVTSPPQPTITR